ncbi:acyl-coenzyme A thioesterase 13 [Punica granatum]|uniref:Acyl-coenzyme A thioesterase 13 n=2 Tax=Punica granatum TaxID=22663 RepID=A0A6P8D3Y8_PUNGR|nr:acyl-coenzyme A thioesterase 13 [Punica granatum]PKI45400.1 hypothetical protein CRG98_034205 [Punica granatum]
MATESAVKVSPDMQPEHAVSVTIFFEGVGVNSSLPAQLAAKDACSNLLRDLLRADRIERGKITCSFTVEPVIANIYGGLHGGAVAAIAERVSIACARTVVAQNKEIFLGELSISYLSAAGKSAEVIVDGSIIRSGRNVTLVSVDFKLKKTGLLVYTARATFFNMPVAKL